MANDQVFDDEIKHSPNKGDLERGRIFESDYREETAAEVAPRLGVARDTTRISNDTTMRKADERTGGKGVGTIALVLSLISLFFAPVFWGIAGIIVGFIARARGANGLGNWAIGIGAAAIIIALFIRPYLY